MKVKMLKSLIFFLSILFCGGVSLFFCIYNSALDQVSILKDDILITLLSGLLVLSIAVITLIYTLVEKIREKMKSMSIENTVYRLIGALKKDTWTIFILLVWIVLVILFRDTDLPGIKWCNEIPFSKTEFVYFTKLFVMFLSFTAIADIILTLFSLLKSIWKM